jgi:hypothetical protein
MNPLARISFPGLAPRGGDGPVRGGCSNPGLFDLGLLGVDTLGIRFAESLSRLGYRRAAAITAERDAMRGGVIEPEWRIYVDRPGGGRPGIFRGPDQVLVSAMPRIEEVCAEAFGGADRVLLCAGASAPLAADGLAALAEVVLKSGCRPGIVLFFDAQEELVESRERAARAFAAARALAESERCAPFVVIDRERALRRYGGPGGAEAAMFDSVSGVLDALIRLPLAPPADSPIEPSAVQARLLARGWSTIGLAATRETGSKALEAAVTEALTTGLVTQAIPASRARSSVVFTITGAAGPGEADLESARAVVAKLLPQAQRIEEAYRDSGDSTRVVAWVGGLPYPESFFRDREPGP